MKRKDEKKQIPAVRPRVVPTNGEIETLGDVPDTSGAIRLGGNQITLGDLPSPNMPDTNPAETPAKMPVVYPRSVAPETLPTEPVAPQTDAVAQMPVVQPRSLTPAEQAEADLNATLNKDYGIRKNQPLLNVQGEQIGTQTIKGKDRDPSFNWKDVLRSAGLGALQGLGAGGLGGAVGGAIAGGIRGSIDRNFDNKLQDQMFVIPRQRAQVEQARQTEAYNQQRELRDAQIQNQLMRPDIEQSKMLNQTRTQLLRQYNSLPSFNDEDADDRAFGDAYQKAFGFRPPTKNADTKSEQIIDQRDGQVYIMQTDKQGKSSVIRVMNDDGTPMRIESKEMLASADKSKQRSLDAAIRNSINVTNLKVAQINAGTRIQTTSMQQQGANYRQAQQIANTRELVKLKMQERKDAEARQDKETVRKIDLAIANAKARAKADGLTDDQIAEMFGDF